MVMAGALLALLAGAPASRAADDIAAYKRAVEARFAQWLEALVAGR